MSEHANALSDLDILEMSPGRLNLAEFSEQMHSQMLAICTIHEMLEAIGRLFSSAQRVRPSMYNEAIKSLMGTSERSHKFHSFIERSIHLPLAAIPLRLPLIIALKDMDIQIAKLIQLLATLREESRTPLSQPAEQRRIILRELDVLALQSEEVVQQAEHLVDRARFKERTYSIV